MFLICTREGSPTPRIYFASSSVLFDWKVPWEFSVAVQWAIFFCRLFFFFFFFFFFLPRVYFLLPQEFLFYRDLFLFCRKHFSFAARFFLLPRLSFFCRRNFCFAVWFFLFPWPISFLLRAFFFCRGNFSFAGGLFLLLWHLRATVDANAKINVFPNIPCTFLLFKASAFLQIFFLRKLKFWEHEFFSIVHVWHSFTY